MLLDFGAPRCTIPRCTKCRLTMRLLRRQHGSKAPSSKQPATAQQRKVSLITAQYPKTIQRSAVLGRARPCEAALGCRRMRRSLRPCAAQALSPQPPPPSGPACCPLSVLQASVEAAMAAFEREFGTFDDIVAHEKQQEASSVASSAPPQEDGEGG